MIIIGVFLKGKPPPYSKNREHQQKGDNLGIIIKHKNSEKYVFYATGIEELCEEVLNIIKDSELFLTGLVLLFVSMLISL